MLDVTSDAGMTLGTVSGNIRIERVTARRVEVDSTSGSITARRVARARAALRTLSGQIEYNGELARGGRYEFQSHSGNVHAIAGGQAGFTLQASSFSGTHPAGLVRGAEGRHRRPAVAARDLRGRQRHADCHHVQRQRDDWPTGATSLISARDTACQPGSPEYSGRSQRRAVPARVPGPRPAGCAWPRLSHPPATRRTPIRAL